MNKRILSIICIIFLLFSLSLCCTAHPGRTDSNGGHTDHYTDEYQYHHGYPTHQHQNDICPYDLDDDTSSNKTKNKNYANNSTNKYHTEQNTDASNTKGTWDIIKTVLWCLLLPLVPTFLIIYLFYGLYQLITKSYMTDLETLTIGVIIYVVIVIFCFNLRF